MKFAFLSLAILFGCTTKRPPTQSTELVYIHGSHFDGSSWDEVRKITNLKIQSIAPSTGKRSLHEAARFYCSQISLKAVLIAHSYGGAIANQMTTYCADKIVEIIYVAAVSPHNNEMSFDLLSQNDQASYSSVVDFTESAVVPKEKQMFLKLMSNNETSNMNILIHSEPASLGSEKLTLDMAVFKSVKKAYIFTSRDMIIELSSQKKYSQRDGITRSRSINSGHLPMLTHASELARFVLALSEAKDDL